MGSSDFPEQNKVQPDIFGKIGVSMARDTLKEQSIFSSSSVKFEVPQKGSGRLQSGTDCKSKASNANRVKANNQRSRNDGPSLCDNDVQLLLASIGFKDTDTEDEHELKERLLEIYLKRLRRGNDHFTQFLSLEEDDELVQINAKQQRIQKRIEELKEARAAGCRTSAEADRYLGLKRRMEAGKNVCGAKEGAHTVGNDQRRAGQASSVSANDLDVVRYSGLLSENEKRLCSEIKIYPLAFLQMQEVISKEIFKGNITSRSDSYHLFQMEPSKIDRVYDMLVRKGIAPP